VANSTESAITGRGDQGQMAAIGVGLRLPGVRGRCRNHGQPILPIMGSRLDWPTAGSGNTLDSPVSAPKARARRRDRPPVAPRAHRAGPGLPAKRPVGATVC